MDNHNYIILEQCPVCKGHNFKHIFLKQWRSSSFTRCKKCQLIFQNPQEPVEYTHERYQSQYFQYEQNNQFNFFDLIKKTINDFQIIQKLPEKAEILEIGSATGLFLRYMNEHGHQSIGIDLCRESVEYGRDMYQVDLRCGRLEDFSFHEHSFDFIHFSHLLEHLNQPVHFLDQIYRLLKKGRFALITTPNASGLFAGIYQESWRCIVDDHLFIFNRNNLKKLCEQLNFRTIGIKTWGSIPQGQSHPLIKKFFDWFTKMSGSGDVMALLLQKK